MIERRKYVRLNAETAVKYKIIGQRQKAAEPAECINISPTGLCLMLQNAINIKTGAKLDLEITMKNCEPFYITGEAVWVKNAGDKDGMNTGKLTAGIKILEIRNDDENRFLLQLCDRMVQKLSGEYPPAKS